MSIPDAGGFKLKNEGMYGSNELISNTQLIFNLKNVAILAQRFPEVSMICGHSGGAWELGVRAIRPDENVFLEFSGGDANSGSVDFAVKELGADRIVWGGHGPSRSYSTEIAKVLEANISHSDRMKIFGGNYRELAKRIFRDKGIPLKI